MSACLWPFADCMCAEFVYCLFQIISSYSAISIPAHVCGLLQNIDLSIENLNYMASDCAQEIMSNTSVSVYVQDFLQNTFPPEDYYHMTSNYVCFSV